MTDLEVKGRCCQAMQALLPLGSRSSASSTPLQAAQGTHPERRVIPMGTHAIMAILGSCLYFLPQEPATMARMEWVTPCTYFSPQELLPNHSKPPEPSLSGIILQRLGNPTSPTNPRGQSLAEELSLQSCLPSPPCLH